MKRNKMDLPMMNGNTGKKETGPKPPQIHRLEMMFVILPLFLLMFMFAKIIQSFLERKICFSIILVQG